MNIEGILRNDRPYRQILVALLNLGISTSLLITLILVILSWPLQALIVYLALLCVAGVAAGVEWHCARRANRAAGEYTWRSCTLDDPVRKDTAGE